ncbi:MAG: peptide-N-glycosidase F-related protein [Flavipsychrobacter sp.]
MKKILGIISALVLIVSVSKAAPGDTTWVQAHYDVQMNHFGNFDSSVKFPDGTKTYRKVFMVWTLGRYQCPGNPQYCGDWDYTVSTHLMTKGGDTLELGRYITPYSGDGVPRIGSGAAVENWKQRYTFDVTDFYNVLKDTAAIRVHYSGYSWGFTANVKFAFIEGTPARNVLGMDKMWAKSYAYHTGNPIDNNVTSLNKTSPAGTQAAELKFTISGHGNNGENCAEFCKKYYQVKLNNNLLYQKDIWRDDCGYNHFYPQNGTWIYNRGNWCPGDIVFTNSHPLTGVGASANYDLDVDFQAATASSGGSYTIQSAVVYYGGFNKTLDVSLDDIIAPNNHEIHFRENPIVGRPKVIVQNTGSTTITSIKFQYSIAGVGQPETYTWNGSLTSLKTAEIELAKFAALNTVTGTNTFNVEVIEVNGKADDDATNNKLSSEFEGVPIWDNTVTISMRTNANTVGGVSETSWRLYDIDNNVVQERINNQANTTYNDTLKIGPGGYKLVVTDLGCNGLSWWANPNGGTGSFALRKAPGIVPVALKGYFGGDFGCGFTQYFYYKFPTAVKNINEQLASFKVFPNPAANSVNVTIEGLTTIDGTINIVDMLGRVVVSERTTTSQNTINIDRLTSGVYNVVYSTNTGDGTIKLQQKLVVDK